MSTWDDAVERLEREGEAFAPFVTDAVERISALRADEVRHVLDLGSGPGVGTCQLASGFPDAHVVAVDGSAAMLERVTARASRLGLGDRVRTHLADLPGGLDDLEAVDLLWAGMSLHHVGDEEQVLRALRSRLRDGGLLAVVERADGHGPGLVSMLSAAGYDVVDHRLVTATVGPSPERQIALAKPSVGT